MASDPKEIVKFICYHVKCVILAPSGPASEEENTHRPDA